MRTNAKKIFQNLAKKLKAAQAAAPKILANEGQKFFVENFSRQGWRGDVFQKWPARKDRRNRRSLLVGRTRQLLNSVRRSIREANQKRIRWATEVPYAAIHNEGYNGLIRVRSHNRGVFSTSKAGTGVYNIRSRKERMKSVRSRTGDRRVLNYTKRMRMPQRKFMGAGRILGKILLKKYAEIFHTYLSRR